jgi:hypothetical protein
VLALLHHVLLPPSPVVGLWLPTVPQISAVMGLELVICLALGYLGARKTGGDLVDWLAVTFLTSLVPVLGVVLAALLWWRPPRRLRAHTQPSADPPAGP